jgi:DNA-directed RNA polymerase specialized sigma24 family protein
MAPMPSRRVLLSLRRALVALPDPDRTIFARHWVDGWDYHQIALDLGLSVPEVERGVARAILALDAAVRQAGRPSWRVRAGRICAWLRAKLPQGWRR